MKHLDIPSSIGTISSFHASQIEFLLTWPVGAVELLV
jgi:hypothetical protein